MAIWGADVQELKTLGKKLSSGSNDLDRIGRNLDNLLHNTDWTGPDAKRFSDEWHSRHLPSLNKAAQALDDAGKKAVKNAAQQEQASH
ncbi:hypothetical protein BIU82_19035 [Arthrobacter sp. SW1]|uniref:WXG100 family type VII secretion target n=1 Tax=Arthrobacter sp. SW1 TaxID=1920889 RepID=UPI000877BC29|nr:hypothetical protein [Arthrobacter sp. SW1]OFI37557.1 hypothetical protein BIU82_19035 [Arthrobacter sp. SW1]